MTRMWWFIREPYYAGPECYGRDGRWRGMVGARWAMERAWRKTRMWVAKRAFDLFHDPCWAQLVGWACSGDDGIRELLDLRRGATYCGWCGCCFGRKLERTTDLTGEELADEVRRQCSIAIERVEP